VARQRRDAPIAAAAAAAADAHVPHTDGLVTPGRGEEVRATTAIAGGDRPHPPLVARMRRDGAPGRGVPHTDDPVFAAADDGGAGGDRRNASELRGAVGGGDTPSGAAAAAADATAVATAVAGAVKG